MRLLLKEKKRKKQCQDFRKINKKKRNKEKDSIKLVTLKESRNSSVLNYFKTELSYKHY